MRTRRAITSSITLTSIRETGGCLRGSSETTGIRLLQRKKAGDERATGAPQVAQAALAPHLNARGPGPLTHPQVPPRDRMTLRFRAPRLDGRRPGQLLQGRREPTGVQRHDRPRPPGSRRSDPPAASSARSRGDLHRQGPRGRFDLWHSKRESASEELHKCKSTSKGPLGSSFGDDEWCQGLADVHRGMALKIFISSVVSGLEDARDAAAVGIETLGSRARRAEDFGASPDTPQRTCLAGVRDADAIILILGERYGDIQESGLSATHEEYREAKERRPVLVFVQENIEMDPQQRRFLEEVQGWSSGHYTESWTDPDDLRGRVTRVLHDFELSRSLGPLDEEEVLQRALALLPDERAGIGGGASLIVAISGGPRQQVLRPSELEEGALHRELMREASYGAVAVLDPAQGTRARVEGSDLHIVQDTRSIRLSELGDVCIAVPATSEDPMRMGDLPVLIDEYILDQIRNSLRFAGWLLDHIDELRRMSDVGPVVHVTGGSYLGWRTRAEQLARPDTYSMNPTAEQKPIHLSPALRKRVALIQDVDRIAEDMLVLLRRQRR